MEPLENTDPVATPITVSASALPAQAQTSLRAALIALGGWLVGRGYISNDLLQAIVPIALIVGPAVWGLLKARSNNAKLQTLANHVPDSVAKVV